jgi:hypothetical protein
MYHYARAVAYAAKKDAPARQREIDAIAKLEATTDFKPFAEWNLPAKEIMQTARHVATGRLADAQGDLAKAAAAYEDAVFTQDTLSYTEPPYWYYPVRSRSAASCCGKASSTRPRRRSANRSCARATTAGRSRACRGLQAKGDAKAEKAARAAVCEDLDGAARPGCREALKRGSHDDASVDLRARGRARKRFASAYVMPAHAEPAKGTGRGRRPHGGAPARVAGRRARRGRSEEDDPARRVLGDRHRREDQGLREDVVHRRQRRRGMTIDLDNGPRINYWVALNGQRVQHSGTLEPKVLGATANDAKRVAGKLAFDQSGSGGAKVDVQFDAPLAKAFTTP